MNEQDTNEFINIVRKLETSVKFDLHPEDLYVMRPRMTPRLSPMNPPLSEESDCVLGSPDSFEPPELHNISTSPKPGLLNHLLAKASALSEKFKRSKTVKLARLNCTSEVFEDSEFESVRIETTSAHKPEISITNMQICPERGLAAQNYCCIDCQNGIGLNDAIRCDFNGGYYCRACHGGWEGINPVRLIRNWDTKKYPISKPSRKVISHIDYSELINFASVNPKIFKDFEAFSYISALRKEIVKMAQRRLTGLSSVDRKRQLARMEKLSWPKTHLLTTAKLYTIEDLTEIANGTFYARVLLPLYNALKI